MKVSVGVLVLVIGKVKTTHEQITVHLRDQRRGEILRDGCRIAILGAPNAGKVRGWTFLRSSQILIIFVSSEFVAQSSQ